MIKPSHILRRIKPPTQRLMASYNELQKPISDAVKATIRDSIGLRAEDLDFHRSLDRKVADRLDKQNARLLGLTQQLLGSAAAGSDVVGPTFPDGKEDVERKWRNIVNVLDSLLEKADINLDEFTGARKRVEVAEPVPVRRISCRSSPYGSELWNPR